MNYQDLQYKYGKPKKKKNKKLTEENYPLGKKHFSSNEWIDYKDWLKEQKLKEELQNKAKKKKKNSKGNNTKKKDKKPLQEPKNAKEEYSRLLQDEHWKEKRLKILSRYGNQCIMCGSKNNINVHHLLYKKGHKPWEYEDKDLIPLCKECHEKVHNDPNHEYYPKYL